MQKTRAKSATRAAAPAAPEVARGAWLTQAAFVLAVAMVVARATTVEILRDPFDVTPGGQNIPRGAGPATGLWLDLLCCIPAVLVLVRRVVDSKYVVRWSWSQGVLALLAIWAMASRFWAADKFAATVSAFHLLCSFVLLWSVSQLVRSWLRLRLVAAAAVGLLLIQLAHGFEYRFIEFPELRQSWEQKKDEILRERGWAPGSFNATQFERKIIGGEVFGFTASPNTLAALLVLLGVVTFGVGVQKWVDSADEPNERPVVALYAITLILTVVLGAFAKSKTAAVTPVLAVAALLGLWRWRGWLARHWKQAYAAGVAVAALGIAAVVGHGIWHGSLPSDSLTFRWQYWVGAAAMFRAHPWLGVGWENFGPAYLRFRLPVASEEIKDPHNFLVRVATELGVIGLVLVLGWMLRLAWELVRPVTPKAGDAKTHGKWYAVILAAAVGLVAMFVNAVIAIDYSQTPGYVIYEVLRRLLFLGVFVLGMSLASLRSIHHAGVDDRPAPWVLYATLTALGVFLLHNLVDFSLFELGPMYVFMMLAGAVLGVRTPTAAGKRRHTRVATAVLGAAGAAWAVAALAFALPVSEAEGLAHDADDNLRNGRPEVAAAQYREAFRGIPWNADYAFRAARALTYASAPPGEVRAMLIAAAAANPVAVEYHLWRATFEMQVPEAERDAAEVRRAYRRVLELNPNDVPLRLQYAAAIEKTDPKEAAEQYRTALRYNDRLKWDEVKRLSPEKVREVEGRIAALEGK